MKKLLTFICCFGIVMSSLLYAGSIFCSHLISHSLINVAIDQINLEEKLTDVFSMLDFPDGSNEAAMIDGMIKEIANDEEVVKEINKYADAFIADIVNDEVSNTTSDLNNVIKRKVVAYAGDISALTNSMISKESVSSLLSESVDIMNIQSLYNTLVTEMKAQFSPTQKLMLRTVSFMQSEICLYGSLIAMIAFSIIVLLLNLAWLEGLVSIGVSWLLSAISLFALSKLMPTIMNTVFSEAKAGISDNVAQLTKLSAIYFAIFIVCVIVKVVYNRLFIKE